MHATGAQVKLERERRGWTQNELARRISRAQGTLVGIEKMASLTTKHILKFDKVFGGDAWRTEPIIRDSAPNYQRSLEQKVDALTNLVQRLVERVEVLEGARRSVQK